jgi:hypothetical protein
VLRIANRAVRESRCGAAGLTESTMVGAFNVIPTFRYLHVRHERLLGAISGQDG